MGTLNALKTVSMQLRKDRNPISGAIAAVLSNASQIAKDRSTDKSNFEVTDSDAVVAIQKALKQSRETLEILASKNDNTSDLYLNASAELAVLSGLLPAVPSSDAVEQFVRQYIEDNDVPNAISSMGAVMKATREHFGPTLNGSEASSIIKSILM